jgi:hypothetical protein
VVTVVRINHGRVSTTFLGIALLAGCGLLGQATGGSAKRTFIHERDVDTAYVWHSFPRWNGGLLVGYENNDSKGPLIYTIDRDLKRDETLFTLQDGARITLYNIAAAPNGEIAIVGGALTSDTRAATFLARISPDRQRQVVTRTWPYRPAVVTIAQDGTVWTVGNLQNEEGTRDIHGHFMRRFDPSGKMLGSANVQVNEFHSTDDVTFLCASLDRVGWFTGREYIEYSLDGSELARFDGPSGAAESDVTGVVLSEGNEVVAGRFGGGKSEFVVLDRETRSWTPVSLAKEHAPAWARVLGFDGTTLVTTSINGKLSRFKTK